MSRAGRARPCAMYIHSVYGTRQVSRARSSPPAVLVCILRVNRRLITAGLPVLSSVLVAQQLPITFLSPCALSLYLRFIGTRARIHSVIFNGLRIDDGAIIVSRYAFVDFENELIRNLNG